MSKFIQIAIGEGWKPHALADDGSVWFYDIKTEAWWPVSMERGSYGDDEPGLPRPTPGT